MDRYYLIHDVVLFQEDTPKFSPSFKRKNCLGNVPNNGLLEKFKISGRERHTEAGWPSGLVRGRMDRMVLG